MTTVLSEPSGAAGLEPLSDPMGPVPHLELPTPPSAPADPGWGADLPPDRPRAVGGRSRDENLSLLGAAAGSLALTWLLFQAWLNLSGAVGFFAVWFVLLVGVHALVSLLGNPGVVVRDRLATDVLAAGALVVLAALGWIVVSVVTKGWPALHHWNLWTQDAAGVRPTDPLTRGGILHAYVGSLVEIALAVAVTLPLGIGTAVYMTEVRGATSRFVRTIVEAMTALPSVVAGLFVYTVLIILLHVPRSGLTAAAAISVMMLPIIARAADVQLRVVPGGLREASLALGATQWTTMRRVVLPTARPGLATALILGVARGIGETSPVLLTSGSNTVLNPDPTKGLGSAFHSLVFEPMQSLPLYILGSVRSGEPDQIVRGYGAAAVLLLVVLVLFALTRFLARARPGRR